MSAHISALGYAWFAHCLAFLIAPRTIPLDERLRALFLWVGSAAALFLLRDTFLVFIAVAIILTALSPLTAAPRVAFFLIAVPILPHSLQELIPFPGLNYLIALTPYKLVSAVLLIPVLMMRRPARAGALKFTVSDACVIAYILYTTVHVTATGNLTVGLRHLVDQCLVFALPYFALRRAIVSLDDLNYCFRAFLICSMSLAMIAFVSTWKQWDFYRLLDSWTVISIPEYRAGFLRISATTSTHSLGLFAGIGLALLEIKKSELEISRFRLLCLRGILVGGLFVTGSRGAMVGTVLAFIFYLSVLTERPFVRWIYVLVATLGLVAMALWLMLADFEASPNFEAAGTFVYRQELLAVSVRHIQKYPIFGDYQFFSRPEFELLRQGSGIVDITNLYLQVALHFGLSGFVMFFGIYFLPILPGVKFSFGGSGGKMRTVVFYPPGLTDWSVLSRSTRRERRVAIPEDWRPHSKGALMPGASQPKSAADLKEPSQKALRRRCGLLLGILVGWLFLISTTSDSGSTVHLGIVSVAMLNAVLRIADAGTSPQK
jgi:hypothetical protein